MYILAFIKELQHVYPSHQVVEDIFLMHVDRNQCLVFRSLNFGQLLSGAVDKRAE